MTDKQYQPNPDDRSDNVEKLQNKIEDTIQNIEKAEESLEFSNGKNREEIKAKNERRAEAIEGFREEIQDEYHHNQ